MKVVKDYIWFIKESQSYMKGHNPVLVFLKSLFLGVGFCRNMKKWYEVEKKYGAETAYCQLNRTMEL